MKSFKLYNTNPVLNREDKKVLWLLAVGLIVLAFEFTIIVIGG